MRFFAHSISPGQLPAWHEPVRRRQCVGERGDQRRLRVQDLRDVATLVPGEQPVSAATGPRHGTCALRRRRPRARCSRARSSRAAFSVKVTASSAVAGNAPVATCCAMRWVIVVVLPVPAPARIATGPRTAVAACRWRSLSRPRIGSSELRATRAPRPDRSSRPDKGRSGDILALGSLGGGCLRCSERERGRNVISFPDPNGRVQSRALGGR